MADLGEINVEVKSEGAEEAGRSAQQGAEGAGGGRGGGGDTLGTAIRGGFVGGLLSQALGPVLDILDPILKILQAFLAPVAVLLMRLLTPVLRGLIKLLPLWMRFIDRVGPLIATLAVVPAIMWRMIRDLGGWFAGLPGEIWAKVKQLGSLIWTKFKSTFPGLASAMERLMTQSNRPGQGPWVRDPTGFFAGRFDFLDRGEDRPTTPWGRMGQGNDPPEINIFGGLDQFISRLTRNGRFDFP